jgi:hypothetical protein
MNKIFKKSMNLMGLVIIVSIYTNLAWAADSATYAVTCSIPAIPGVNAPLIEEAIPKTQLNNSLQQQSIQNDSNNNEQNKTMEVMKEELKDTTDLAKGESQTIIVQTFYSR